MLTSVGAAKVSAMLRYDRPRVPPGLVSTVLKRAPWAETAASPRSLWLGAALLSVAGMLLCGCSKDETPPETIPFKEATAEPASNDSEDADSDSDEDGDTPESDASAAEPTAAMPPKPAVNPQGGKASPRAGASIDNCCGALSTQARIAKEASQVARYKQASRVCYSISKLVKEGKTSRSSALRQVRAVAGNAVPGNCR